MAITNKATIPHTNYLLFISIILTFGSIVFYSSYFSLNFFVKKNIRFFWLPVIYFVLVEILINVSNSTVEWLIILIQVIYFNIFGFLFKTFIEWINDRKIKAELEKDKVTSQLELLKSQINPHFLFNTLNNIDVLILDNPPKASDYLKKLSEILRFMLYETNNERVLVSKEIEYIKKFIELQKIRTQNNKFVEFEIIGKTEDVFIAPMIFIHFVENAFKFSTNKKIENAISIHFDISNTKVSFRCKNHINPTKIDSKENNGLGFALIKKRLELIYGMDYNLSVSNENSWYIVKLEIKLKND